MKRVTVFSELRREFAGLTGRLSVSVGGFLRRFPRPVFSVMVVLMVFSVYLCFTFLRVGPRKAVVSSSVQLGASSGSALSGFGATAGKLSRVLELQGMLKVLLAKDSLDSRDSLLMRSMIGEIENLGVKH